MKPHTIYFVQLHIVLLLVWLSAAHFGPVEWTWKLVLAVIWIPVAYNFILAAGRGFVAGFRRSMDAHRKAR